RLPARPVCPRQRASCCWPTARLSAATSACGPPPQRGSPHRLLTPRPAFPHRLPLRLTARPATFPDSPPHPLDVLGSPASARSPLLSRAQLRCPRLPLVTVATHPSVLGTLLPSAAAGYRALSPAGQ